MQWDIESQLVDKSYKKDEKTGNFVKRVEKQIDYTDSNDKIVFSSMFSFRIVVKTCENEVEDAYIVPNVPFCARTERDMNAISEVFNEMQDDLGQIVPIYDA